jgi:hypothetical protein
VAVVQQLEARDGDIGMLGQRHARPPLVPAALATVIVELGADEADDDGFLLFHIV